ncbi:MAG: SurA N-terminal domain-containing protein [Desulfobacterales bacterium]|nr:SurA N-terminal domain-containing protein [Desulfobacterales bacterium]MDJ0915614.1 SurA N-terminal domain-containing protein [Desulfobacterales bacterium]
MKCKYLNILVIAFLVSIICFTLACSDSKSKTNDAYLLRVRESVVTVEDFKKAFEIAKSAYSHNIMQDPVAYREAQYRLLNQMTEEIILHERAKDLNIVISEQEMEQAIADIKGDYPEGVFEQTLLENAISYEIWKKGLRNRLLMEKVVAKELEEQITINSQDIAKYYQEQLSNSDSETDNTQTPNNINEMIIKHLRREKAEKAYKTWISKLQPDYPVEINWEQWEKLIGS